MVVIVLSETRSCRSKRSSPWPSIRVRPQDGLSFRVGELRRDAEAFPDAPDAAGEDVTYAELAAHRPHVGRSFAKARGGGARDDEQIRKRRECDDHVLGDDRRPKYWLEPPVSISRNGKHRDRRAMRRPRRGSLGNAAPTWGDRCRSR